MGMNRCEMANLDFLEDPESDPKRIFIEFDEVPNLPMYCRGGQSCCNKNHLERYCILLPIVDIFRFKFSSCKTIYHYYFTGPFPTRNLPFI